jgi:hypothetical protein
MKIACWKYNFHDLLFDAMTMRFNELTVIVPGEQSYPLAEGIRVEGIDHFCQSSR